MSTGCAGSGRRGVGTFGAKANGHLARREIHNCGNDKEGRDAVWSIIEQFGVLSFDGPKVADAAADVGADILRYVIRKLTCFGKRQPTIRNGLHRRCDSVM